MDIGIIYQNNNVYITHIDNLSSEYNVEVTGVLTLIENILKIPGRKDGIERVLTWNPVSQNLPNSVRSLKFDIEELKSVKRAVMSVGNCHSYMIFSTVDGRSSPVLIFRNGGTMELIYKLENYLCVTKSVKDHFLFLMEPRREEAVLKSFDGLGIFTATREAQAGKFGAVTAGSRNVRRQSPLWSGITNLGAHITTKLAGSTTTVTGCDDIRELLREDAAGLGEDQSRLNSSLDNETGFEVVSRLQVRLPVRSPVRRSAPLSKAEWRRHLSPDGTVTCVEQLKEKIFKGGLEKSLRAVVWPYLLGYRRWDFSRAQNEAISRDQRKLYEKLRMQWENIFPEQEERFATFRDRKSIIEKDMLRTDRTIDFYSDENGSLKFLYNILLSYSMYNFDLGYVQGMNDLLAPILYLVQDEVDSFGCFVHLMDTLESNFSEEQLGIKKQFRQLHTLLQIFDPEYAEYLDSKGCRDMLFCFRWLLVNFKRELSYENTMLLWEVLWTNHRCHNFHLLFALAVLLAEKSRVIENRYGFNEILKHVNDLSLNEDVQTHLCTAESLYLQLEHVWPELPEEMRDVLDMRIQCGPPAADREARSADDLFSLIDLPPPGDSIH